MSNIGMFDSAGAAFEAFITDTRGGQLVDLATAIANEAGLEALTIRVIVNFDGEELTNITFASR